MNSKKSVKILKLLIANHTDRIVCYETGQHETDDQELKSMFSHFMQISKKMKEELSNEIGESGGALPDSVREGSIFSLACTKILNVLKRKEKDEILSACEHSENVMVAVYDRVLTDYEDEIPNDLQVSLIKRQQKLLKANRKEVIDAYYQFTSKH